MIIQNAYVLTPDFGFQQKDISIENNRFADTTTDTLTIDASGKYLVPGFIDIHFHGCAGYDFCDATPEALTHMAAYELQQGITSICPASMTLSLEKLTEVCKNAADYAGIWRPDSNMARLCGINLEGPFISAAKKGAQNPAYITAPDMKMLHTLYEASAHMVKLITIAPELEGAMEFIAKASQNLRVSLGHTACDYDLAMEAFAKGARHVTHLYNAMQPFTHRAPGLIGAAFDSKEVTVELICDGIHISPAAIRAAYALYGDSRVILISDSMMATGMADGTYALGGLPVTVKGNLATLEDNTLAGSATNLADCVRTAVKMGISLEAAVNSATINPARAIGIDRDYGSIETGKIADCLLLNDDLSLHQVILQGRPVA